MRFCLVVLAAVFAFAQLPARANDFSEQGTKMGRDLAYKKHGKDKKKAKAGKKEKAKKAAKADKSAKKEKLHKKGKKQRHAAAGGKKRSRADADYARIPSPTETKNSLEDDLPTPNIPLED